jgi:hypothetical protein
MESDLVTHTAQHGRLVLYIYNRQVTDTHMYCYS